MADDAADNDVLLLLVALELLPGLLLTPPGPTAAAAELELVGGLMPGMLDWELLRSRFS